MKQILSTISLPFLIIIVWIGYWTTYSTPDSVSVMIAKKRLSDTVPTEDSIVKETESSLNHTETNDSCTLINTATKDELIALPAIGPVLAERIIQYRQSEGSIKSFEDLDRIKGIGPATLRKLKRFICFD